MYLLIRCHHEPAEQLHLTGGTNTIVFPYLMFHNGCGKHCSMPQFKISYVLNRFEIW